MPAQTSQRSPLGDFIVSRREALGYSQSELAERAGLTRAYMNSIERGKLGLPGVDQRRALAEALRVRHVDLLVAAGELAHDELAAPVYRDFVRHPGLMKQVEDLDIATAETLSRFLAHFQAAVDDARAEQVVDHETGVSVPASGIRASMLPDDV